MCVYPKYYPTYSRDEKFSTSLYEFSDQTTAPKNERMNFEFIYGNGMMSKSHLED